MLERMGYTDSRPQPATDDDATPAVSKYTSGQVSRPHRPHQCSHQSYPLEFRRSRLRRYCKFLVNYGIARNLLVTRRTAMKQGAQVRAVYNPLRYLLTLATGTILQDRKTE